MPLDETNYENHIPAAVRRASERADAAARAAGIAGVPSLEESPAADPPPEPPADPPPEPAAASTLADTPPAADWEQRYRTLQGKYDSELPQLRGQVAALERLLATMQVPREQTPAPTARVETTGPVAIDPAEVEAYGEDLIGAARRWARVELQSEIDALNQKIEELSTGQRQLGADSVQQRVATALDADPELAGRWRTLNTDSEFLGWVAEVDVLAGRPRIEMMREAFAAGDAVRTGRFFKSFLAEHTAVNQPPPAPNPHTPVAEGAGGQVSLESLAAPGRATGAGVSGGATREKRTWTHREISAFYRDRVQGKYVGREAESQRTERDIHDAITEGRIR